MANLTEPRPEKSETNVRRSKPCANTSIACHLVGRCTLAAAYVSPAPVVHEAPTQPLRLEVDLMAAAQGR